MEAFEKAYLQQTEQFYKSRISEILQSNGILNYMAYADEKLLEEEQRAKRYLDTSAAESVDRVSIERG